MQILVRVVCGAIFICCCVGIYRAIHAGKTTWEAYEDADLSHYEKTKNPVKFWAVIFFWTAVGLVMAYGAMLGLPAE